MFGVGLWDDLFSLGAILYEMVTGNVPYEGNTPLLIMNARLTGDPIAPRKVNPEISEQVEEIILHALDRDPNNRYPSAWAMKQDLDNPSKVEVTGRALRLQPVKPWQGGWRRHRTMIITVTLTLLAFAIWWVSTKMDVQVKLK